MSHNPIATMFRTQNGKKLGFVPLLKHVSNTSIKVLGDLEIMRENMVLENEFVISIFEISS